MNLLTIAVYSFLLFFQEPLENKLERMIGKNRVVLVYCPIVSEAEFKLQKKWLNEVGTGISGRDLSVIDCIESALSPKDILHLKERFNYSPNHFCMWVIGKDGEIKLISGKPVKPEQLIGLLDSLPVSRGEMKKN